MNKQGTLVLPQIVTALAVSHRTSVLGFNISKYGSRVRYISILGEDSGVGVFEELHQEQQ